MCFLTTLLLSWDLMLLLGSRGRLSQHILTKTTFWKGLPKTPAIAGGLQIVWLSIYRLPFLQSNMTGPITHLLQEGPNGLLLKT